MYDVRPPEPTISLVRGPAGEVTLLIDDVQAMQGWERELMVRSADLLCREGTDFLEVGLGLGISAERIASRPGVRRHTVVEKHRTVIALFEEEHPSPPPALDLVQADFLDVVDSLPPGGYDGVFFDPELPREVFEDREFIDVLMKKLVGLLRPGGRFVPMFAIAGEVPDAATCTTSPGEMLERYIRFFDRVEVERHPYTAYADTAYTPNRTGEAYLLCFQR